MIALTLDSPSIVIEASRDLGEALLLSSAVVLPCGRPASR